ncbi:hypothetical protein VIAQ111709_00630 [Vibrio aquimaris]|uniref:Uncharacterized protein n=1 Tax=Vibrio aquimaris TaxID=2587862 RepID=A0A5P9CLN1_9VIBR|nr:hypothetical protein FIV01_11955 [Vibrio aquimaris]
MPIYEMFFFKLIIFQLLTIFTVTFLQQFDSKEI